MQRTVVRDKPMSLGELYDALYNGGRRDEYSCVFIDRKDSGGNNLPKLFKDLNISDTINDNEFISL